MQKVKSYGCRSGVWLDMEMSLVACLSSGIFIVDAEISCIYNLTACHTAVWLEQVWNFDLWIANLLQLVFSFAAGSCYWFLKLMIIIMCCSERKQRA